MDASEIDEQTMYTRLLAQSSRVLTKGNIQELTEALEVRDLMCHDAQVLNTEATKRCAPPVLLEVFAGSMHLSVAAAQRGWKFFSQ